MIKWSEVPDNFKLIAYAVGVLGGCVLWLNSNYVTVSASEQQWAAHDQAIACKTVADLREERRVIETRIQFDESLTEKNIKWLEAQLEDIKKEIQKTDPNNVC